MGVRSSDGVRAHNLLYLPDSENHLLVAPVGRRSVEGAKASEIPYKLGSLANYRQPEPSDVALARMQGIKEAH